MTELQLYKFITTTSIEWRWQNNHNAEGKLDVLIMPTPDEANELMQLLTGNIFEDGIEITMMKGYFCIWMQEICDYYGIDIHAVFGTIDL
jgi:hypothetical protein